MNFLAEPQNRALKTAIIFVLLASWLSLERYHGFFHDGMLYSMLALYRLIPDNFKNDLFVAFGSQDSFTVFTALFAALAKQTGLNSAAFILTVSGQILWVASFVVLLRRISSGWAGVLAAACLVYCSRYYDAYLMFSYAEPFPTPRIFSESLSLLAITALFDRYYIRASVCLAVAVAFHPLMCLYVVLLVIVAFLSDSAVSRLTRLCVLLGGVTVVLFLVGRHIPPFDGFLQSYDEAWYRAFQATSETSTLPSLWTLGTALRVAYLMLVMGIAWWQKIPVLSRWIPLCLAVAAGLLGVWVLGASLWHDRLLIQLQPWRCIWMLQILALVAQGVLFHKLWLSGGADRWLAGFMLVALLQVGYASADGTYAFSLVAIGLAVRFMLARLLGDAIKRSPWNFIPALLPLPQLAVNALRAWSIRGSAIVSATSTEILSLTMCALAGAVLTALFWRVFARQARPGKSVLLAFHCGVACVAAAAYLWSIPFVEGKSSLAPHQQNLLARLQARIPAQAVIYSDYDMLWVWFVLQRSNYADMRQMAGYMFSRGTAVEGLRRFYHLCDAGVPGCLAPGFSIPSGTDPVVFWQRHAGMLCRDGALDYLVLQSKIPGAEIFTDQLGQDTISVVDCRPFH